MSELLLITAPDNFVDVPTATEAARAMRDGLLVQAGKVTTVVDRIDADDAVVVLRTLKMFLTQVEAARETVKAPALKRTREIDGLAREMVTAVKEQEARISRLCGAFEAEERRKAEAARVAAENEAARLAFEAAKATREAIRAAPTPEVGARAVDAIAGAAAQQITAVKASAPVVAKPAASTLRTEVCYEVLDIRQLFKAEPNLVNLEPNGTAIRAIIKANPNIVLPGVRHWTEEKLNVR